MLAKRYGTNPKTGAEWRKRPTVQDARIGPAAASTVLTTGEEAVAVACRRDALLPLTDGLYALPATLAQLLPSVLHPSIPQRPNACGS